ncbi:PAS domain S-box protein [Thermosulfuriphilus sp.]
MKSPGQERESPEVYLSAWKILLEGLSEPAMIIDPNFRILLANEAQAQLLKKRPEELRGQFCYRLLHKAEQPPPFCPHVLTLEEGSPHKAEFYEAPLGYVRVSVSPLKDQSGRTLAVFHVINDAASLGQSPEDLLKIQARYRAMIEGFEGFIYICSADYRIEFMNQAMRACMGPSAIGRRCYEVIFGQKEVCSWCPNPRVLKGETVRWEIQNPLDRRWYYIISTPISHADGSSSVMILLLDITRRKELEDSLLRSEIKYRTLVEDVPVGLYWSSIDGEIIEANQALVDILRYPDRKSFLKANANDLYVNQPDRAHLLKILKAQGWVSNFETQLYTYLGQKVWVRISARLVEEAGRIFLRGAIEDITSIKEAELALKESEARFRAISQMAPDAIVLMDKEGRIIYWNEAASRIFGYSASEALGQELHLFLAPEKYHESYLRAFGRFKRTGKSLLSGRTLEFTAVRKDGTEFPIEVSLSLLRYQEEPVFLGIIRDISQRKKAEETIRRRGDILEAISLAAERFLRASLNKEAMTDVLSRLGEATSADMVILLEFLPSDLPFFKPCCYWLKEGLEDRSGVLTGPLPLAKSAQGLLQVPGEAPRGKRVEELPSQEQLVFREMGLDSLIFVPVFAGKRPWGVMLLGFKESRDWSQAETEALKAAADIIGAALFRERVEQELLKMEKLKSLELLAGGIAHDFNNILTAILGNVSLAKLLDKEGRVAQILDQLEKASLQARNLTQQLLTFAKGSIPVKRKEDIGRLLVETVEFSLSGSNVKAHYDLAPDLWVAEVDQAQISQVIQNLVVNAKQAMPEGGIIEIEARNIRITSRDDLPLPPGPYVRLSIRDQGVGIPEGLLDKIFDPYFTTKQEGSGLGLAIVHSIVSKHGGWIDVVSSLGQGSTFVVYLPALEERIRHRAEGEGPVFRGEGRVLVMDDEEIVRKTLGTMLKTLGYEVAFAKDGQEAVEMYEAALKGGTAFDLVIMDLTVRGGMGGKEALKALLKIDPEVKAVVSSGYSDDPVMANFREFGFLDVVAKPYRMKDLIEVLRRISSPR